MFIVSCGSMKNAGKMPARELYKGNSFTAPKMYANWRYDSDWYILSAKYGVIRCNTIIEDYNVSFKNPVTNPVNASHIAQQMDVIGDVIFIGGSVYIDILQQAWPNARVYNPFVEHGVYWNGMWRKGLHDARLAEVDIITWLSTHAENYFPVHMSDSEIADWIMRNYHKQKSAVRLGHIFRAEGYSCNEHRFERLHKEVTMRMPPPPTLIFEP